MKKIIGFVKTEAVLVISWLLALVSSIFVPPDAEFWGYIDFRTLGILFCLMAVVAGFKELGVFNLLAEKMLNRVKNVRQLLLVLVLLCFFSSMLITNDVALITFVPLTFIILEFAGGEIEKHWLIPTVVMQTIAANLGSMLTPLGNPQNLYLYGISGMSLGSFLLIILPYSALSLVLLLAWIFGGTIRSNPPLNVEIKQKTALGAKYKLAMYVVLFLAGLLTVLRVLKDYRIALAVVLAAVLAADRKVLKNVDYSLLATFVGFFIFIGNIGRIDFFREIIGKLVMGNEVIVSVVSSQIISNVPAALLLSEFTADYGALIVGTNLGGLGTLIASMASLISFKLISHKHGEIKGKYIAWFSVSNIAFLAVLLGYFFISSVF